MRRQTLPWPQASRLQRWAKSPRTPQQLPEARGRTSATMQGRPRRSARQHVRRTVPVLLPVVLRHIAFAATCSGLIPSSAGSAARRARSGIPSYSASQRSARSVATSTSMIQYSVRNAASSDSRRPFPWLQLRAADRRWTARRRRRTPPELRGARQPTSQRPRPRRQRRGLWIRARRRPKCGKQLSTRQSYLGVRHPASWLQAKRPQRRRWQRACLKVRSCRR
mmetsp:Transcript_49795/g.139360  ORF Transcript_49795/g.139360 Transcript_49795/m.139360 type:complete len:223 (-) Transcript_49795:3938-4606(-)